MKNKGLGKLYNSVLGLGACSNIRNGNNNKIKIIIIILIIIIVVVDPYSWVLEGLGIQG